MVCHHGDSSGSYPDKLPYFPQEWCLVKESHWTGKETSYQTSPDIDWCLVRETCQAFTQTSCPYMCDHAPRNEVTPRILVHIYKSHMEQSKKKEYEAEPYTYSPWTLGKTNAG